mmetsp:Transcript_6040/g.6268  ORF Transcript_6040/g.6268 Transcript_6040/m.6268 type:complete len:298 (+) Transcript_6040:451-1344(+)
MLLVPEEYNLNLQTAANKVEINSPESTKLVCHKEFVIDSYFIGEEQEYFQLVCKKIQTKLFKLTAHTPSSILLNVYNTIEAHDLVINNAHTDKSSVLAIKKLLIADAGRIDIKKGLVKLDSVYANRLNCILEGDIEWGMTQVKDLETISVGDSFSVDCLEVESGFLCLNVSKVKIYLKKVEEHLIIVVNLTKLKEFDFKVDDSYLEDTEFSYKVKQIDYKQGESMSSLKEDIERHGKSEENKKKVTVYFYIEDNQSQKKDLLKFEYMSYFESLKERLKNKNPPQRGKKNGKAKKGNN